MLWGRGSPEIGLGTNPPPPTPYANKIKFSLRPQKNFSIHTQMYMNGVKQSVMIFFFRGGGGLTMRVSFTLVISRCHSKFLIFISPAGEDGGPELQPVHDV